MVALKAKKKPNFTNGPMFFRILTFTIPIILTSIIQQLYGTADQIVLGQFSSNANAIGAIGSTSSMTNLVLNVLLGCSVGASVLVAQGIGAKNDDDISKTVHTAITFAAIGGAVITVTGLIIARPILVALNTKPEMLEDAVLYSRIIFLGAIGSAIYNFGAAILRSTGDSRTPLVVLTSTGLVNVILNVVFVAMLNMGIAGVAIATITAKYISAAVVIIKLTRASDATRLIFKRLGIDKRIFGKMMKISIPSAIQSSMFTLSSLFVTGAANVFTPAEVSGKAIAANIENYVSVLISAFYQAALTFVGQNYGAGKFDRVKRAAFYVIAWVTIMTVLSSAVEIIFAREIAYIFIDGTHPEAEIIADAAARRMYIMLPLMFVQGFMTTSTGYLRAIGYSVPPMIAAIVINCGIRIMWITFIFPLPGFTSFLGLYSIYPMTWILCSAINLTIILSVSKKAFAKKAAELEAKAENAN